MHKSSNELSLAEAIDSFLQENKLKEQLLFHRIKNNWAEIAGPQIAEKTERVWLHKGILFIEIKNPVWKAELLYMRDLIKKAINAQVGKELCQEVKIL